MRKITFQSLKNQITMFYNSLRSPLTIFIFITIHLQINAQCAEVNFYRMNTLLQSDKVVLLYQDGVEIARVKKGDRYKTEICSDGQFNFSVKIKSEEISLSKQNIHVENGKKYFVKIACPVTPEVATINQKKESKGKKDLKKGSKFNGAVQQLNLKSVPVIAGGGSYQQPNVTPRSGNSTKFKKTQIVGNFQFDVVSVVKAGDMLSMALKVTNLTSEDLMLYSAYYNIYFYDDLGNLLSANDLCIVNSCEYGNRTITKIKKQAHSRTESLIPYGIPMNMNINVRGIRNGSKKLTRGVFQMGFYRPGNPGVKTGFDLQYFDIEYPEVVDPNNQNRRIFGLNYLELLDAKRKGKDVVARFCFKNGSNEAAKISLQNLSAYDDSGNKYVQREFSVFDGIQKRPHNYSANHDVASNAEIEIEILFPNVATNAQNLRRLTLNLSGYTFEWNNVNIEGAAGERSTVMETRKDNKVNISNYLVYKNLEIKMRNKENVIGKKSHPRKNLLCNRK